MEEEDPEAPILSSKIRSDIVSGHEDDVQAASAQSKTISKRQPPSMDSKLPRTVELTEKPLLDGDERQLEETNQSASIAAATERALQKAAASTGQGGTKTKSYGEITSDTSETSRGEGSGHLLAGDASDGEDDVEHGPLADASVLPGVGSRGTKLSQLWGKLAVMKLSSRQVTFAAIQVQLLIVLVVLTVLGTPSWISTLGFCIWAVLLLFNLLLATRPRMVLREFLNRKGRTRLDRGPSSRGRGQLAVVSGRVSRIVDHGYAEEDIVPGCIVMDTALNSFNHKSPLRWLLPTDSLHQTVALDFRITDEYGMSAVVKARHAAETGVIVGLVHGTTAIPLASSRKVIGFLNPDWLMKEQKFLEEHPELLESDLVITRGYITEGQNVTVLGMLHTAPGSDEPIIEPLESEHNIAKLLLFWRFVPFFYPTLVRGLVVSDQIGFL